MRWIPQTDREKRVVAQHGEDNWDIVKASESVQCFHGQPGVMIQKGEHARWIKPYQVREEVY